MTAPIDIEPAALDAVIRLVADYDRKIPQLAGAGLWLKHQKELRTRRRDFVLSRLPNGLWRLGWPDSFIDVPFRSNGLDFIQLAIIQQGAPVRVDAPSDNAAEQKISRARSFVRRHNLQLARLLNAVRVENGCARYVPESNAPRVITSC